MILEEIRMKDFRCFYGESTISFATDEVKNVTLIYAENGVGKTTLLNALLWCFYGETTTRFEKREDIVNHDAVKEGRSVASVEVQFSHNDNVYIAKRFAGSGKIYNDERNFIIQRIETGSRKELPTPETFINTVIPKEMASHFLFDGEHAEVFLGEDNQVEIRGAVRDILGCSLIETAISDLQSVSNQFRKQMPTAGASDQIDKKNDRIEKLVSEIKSVEEAIEGLEKDYANTRKQIKTIEEKLRNTQASEQLQRTRDNLKQSLAKAHNRKVDFGKEVFRWLGDNGRNIVSKAISEETFDFLEEKENLGRIPSPYNEEFVKDVLTLEQCICGADLKAGSEAAKQVASLLDKAANQVTRDRITKVRARLSELKNGRKKAPIQLAEANRRLAEANEEFDELEAKLSEANEKLKGINFDDIAERTKRQEELERDCSKINRTIGSFRSELERSEREISRLNKEINELAQLDIKTAVFARRRELCDEIRDLLESKLEEEEEQARGVLRTSIKNILDSTSRKSLKLKMSNEYDISLVNSDGIVLPKSSGENQLLGLAFTAALVKFANIRERAEDHRLLPGTVAPLVLDSPFGQLDPAYKITTAEFMPKMARQVVLLVSKSQGSSDVQETLAEHVGAEYLLVRHNSDAQEHRKTESRNLKGKDYQTVFFGSEFDGTEIIEV